VHTDLGIVPFLQSERSSRPTRICFLFSPIFYTLFPSNIFFTTVAVVSQLFKWKNYSVKNLTWSVIDLLNSKVCVQRVKKLFGGNCR
jgi:hypothetical protein